VLPKKAVLDQAQGPQLGSKVETDGIYTEFQKNWLKVRVGNILEKMSFPQILYACKLYNIQGKHF